MPDKPAPCQWISHLKIISQFFWPEGLCSCPLLLWPWKRSHAWHLWSPHQSLNLPCRGLRKRLEKALERERGVAGDLQAIWFSVYLGKGMQILIRLFGSAADVKVACKYPFPLPLAAVHISHTKAILFTETAVGLECSSSERRGW